MKETEINAEDLWERSSEYVEMARQHLSPEPSAFYPEEGIHDRDEWLRINFLFPTLPEKSKLNLLRVRRFFMIAREHQELERDDPDDSAEYSEAMADEVAQELKEALRSFSVPQREILQRHYLIVDER